MFYVQYAHARAFSVIKQSCLSEQELLVYFKTLSKKRFTGEQPENLIKLKMTLFSGSWVSLRLLDCNRKF